MSYQYTAADVISAIETNFDRSLLSEEERVFLLKDLHSIVDGLCRTKLKSKQIISISNNYGKVKISSEIYTRTYVMGELQSDRWHKIDGTAHSFEDKPAIISYFSNGEIDTEEWYYNNVLHRDGDKPAIRAYYRNGQLEMEEWVSNRLRSRDGDKPAFIWYHEDNGKVQLEEWWRDGILSRDEGKPSLIRYDTHGVVVASP